MCHQLSLRGKLKLDSFREWVSSQVVKEKLIAKESLTEQCVCILQGIEDSKEHNPGKSVLNPLQNSSDNHMSAWPCPHHLPGFTNWRMLTSASRHPVRAAAGAVVNCTHMEDITQACCKACQSWETMGYLHICLLPVQGQMMRHALLVPAPALSSHTAKLALLLCLAGHWAAPTNTNDGRCSGCQNDEKEGPKCKFVVAAEYKNKWL